MEPLRPDCTPKPKRFHAGRWDRVGHLFSAKMHHQVPVSVTAAHAVGAEQRTLAERDRGRQQSEESERGDAGR